MLVTAPSALTPSRHMKRAAAFANAATGTPSTSPSIYTARTAKRIRSLIADSTKIHWSRSHGHAWLLVDCCWRLRMACVCTGGTNARPLSSAMIRLIQSLLVGLFTSLSHTMKSLSASHAQRSAAELLSTRPRAAPLAAAAVVHYTTPTRRTAWSDTMARLEFIGGECPLCVFIRMYTNIHPSVSQLDFSQRSYLLRDLSRLGDPTPIGGQVSLSEIDTTASLLRNMLRTVPTAIQI